MRTDEQQCLSMKTIGKYIFSFFTDYCSEFYIFTAIGRRVIFLIELVIAVV